jgi:putative nucleotidyltransferase with HDIG domain
MKNKQKISEGTRIISFGDIVTEDKLEVLSELNLVETGKLDYAFGGGILAIVLMLAFLLILYLHFFCSKFLANRKEIILLCVIILLDLGAAWLLNPFTPFLIPVFIAPMLISILLDLRLGIMVNLLLALAISFITKGDMGFLYTNIIGGTLAAFIVSGANQRSRISASGLVIAMVNAMVITCANLIGKSSAATIANDAALVAVNGMLSTIFTIGTLPVFESIFNIITPLKLLELSNPNQPLVKKLLMEAPGTYHHSLMVGNLAEVATEAINGNALLARVGAYYHDVGKLKRPNFFKENQLSDNPHDRMTPNLSTLVITSHTSDGAEIAEKYKVPLAVREIISQHHGTTLAAYFYYKAKKTDKADSLKQEDFRYQGPRPSSKEAAVVMLADSVEAAVRSMVDKTEGKMEGLI